MSEKKFFFVQKFENSADIYIFGDIVDEQWWSEETSPYSLKTQLEHLDVSEINVHINSYGGSVAAGWAIYNTLKQSGKKIHTYADGFVCSAAIYPFLAGSVRTASALSAFYLHEVWTQTSGNAEDLRAMADEIEKMTEIGISAIADTSGMSDETVRELIKAETWLTPAEAKDCGIATELAEDEGTGASQRLAKQIMQRFFATPDEKQKAAPAEKEPEQKAEPAQQAEPAKKTEKSLMELLAESFN